MSSVLSNRFARPPSSPGLNLCVFCEISDQSCVLSLSINICMEIYLNVVDAFAKFSLLNASNAKGL